MQENVCDKAEAASVPLTVSPLPCEPPLDDDDAYQMRAAVGKSRSRPAPTRVWRDTIASGFTAEPAGRPWARAAAFRALLAMAAFSLSPLSPGELRSMAGHLPLLSSLSLSAPRRLLPSLYLFTSSPPGALAAR